MPRLETFSMKVATGERGLGVTPKFAINGFPLDFDDVQGGFGPGETAELKASPQSFPHSLVLVGPDEGAWDVRDILITYHCAGAQPYSVRLGSVTLEDDTDLNIWHQRPARVLDV